MNEHGIKSVLSVATKMKPFNIMAMKAYHNLGEISRDKYDLAHVDFETKNYYVGSWVTGFGFINVIFPKNTSRKLTQPEIAKFNSKSIRISNGPCIPLDVKNSQEKNVKSKWEDRRSNFDNFICYSELLIGNLKLKITLHTSPKLVWECSCYGLINKIKLASPILSEAKCQAKAKLQIMLREALDELIGKDA